MKYYVIKSHKCGKCYYVTVGKSFTNIYPFSVSPQLAGTAVLAIGLWLRFDSQTKTMFETDTNGNSFYTGKSPIH